MNRFPANLDLSYLVGRMVEYIGISQHVLDVNLGQEMLSCVRRKDGSLESMEMDDPVNLQIEGPWSLTDAQGAVIDEKLEHPDRDCYRVHRLLGLKLTAYAVVSPTTLELKFEHGFSLSILDESDYYESLNITYGKTHITI